MRSRLWLGRERMAWTMLVVGVGAGAGCGQEPAVEVSSDEPVAESAGGATESARDTAVTQLRRFLPDEMRRSTRAETFPHEAHVPIDCSVCHQLPQGHTTHTDVQCAQCHRASALATVRSLTPEQCAACHHSAQQTLECRSCHEPPGLVASEQRLALEVWSEARMRALSFDHDVHVDLDCVRCHRSSPLLTPAESCASCHSEHHAVGVRCQSCHSPPPPTAHGVEAHLTCSGAGCHRAPEVEALADDRAVCLVCHTAQEEHEPEGTCVECHRVRPGVESRPGS